MTLGQICALGDPLDIHGTGEAAGLQNDRLPKIIRKLDQIAVEGQCGEIDGFGTRFRTREIDPVVMFDVEMTVVLFIRLHGSNHDATGKFNFRVIGSLLADKRDTCKLRI